MHKNGTWQRMCIKDICNSIIDCVNKTAPPVNYPTPYKMLRTTNVKAGWVNLVDVKYVTEDVYKKWTRRAVPQQGDVILTREAPLGEVGMLRTNDNVFLGQRLVQYQADPTKLDNRFLLYSFQADDLQGQIKAFGSGATVEHMRVPDAEKLTLLVPPLQIQRKIADILSAYDDLMENNTRRIKILEEMAQTLYREWFINFRFPGYEQTKLADSELGLIPEDWNVVSFTDITDVLSGGTPKTEIPEYWNGAIPFFTPRDAPSSFYVTETEKNITELGLRKCNSKLYPKNTVFITARGTVGKAVMAAVNMAMNQSCFALKGQNNINQYFVFLTINNYVGSLKKTASGATFDAIIIDTFRRLRVIKPPLVLIEEFSGLISPVFEQVLNLLSKNANLRQTRDLLLPKLISGEIDVENLDIESETTAA